MTEQSKLAAMSRLKDFLSGAYYAVTISGVCVGLVIWVIRQQDRIDLLQTQIVALHETDQTFRTDLQALQEHGTRALSERVSVVNSQMLNFEQRLTAYGNRLNEHETVMRKIEVVASRQDEVLRRLTVVEGRVFPTTPPPH